MNDKVSVIIPTYKRNDFLQRAVDSVLNQTYRSIEVVVVDDNEPNSSYRLATEKVLEKYKNITNFRLLKNYKNLGGGLARNQGIIHSTGDYISFLDDDDIYLPDKISIQIQYMKENQLDLSFTDVRMHNSDDKLVDFRGHTYVKSLLNNDLLKQHLLHHLTPTATYMYKRESILSIGGFDDLKMGQEFMLMLKSIESGMKIGYVPVANVIQYLHEGERISVGSNKINGEVQLYKFKQKYFDLLNIREKRYIKFRHHAVMMVVGLRSRLLYLAIEHFFRAFFASPLDCIIETFNHVRKLSIQRNS